MHRHYLTIYEFGALLATDVFRHEKLFVNTRQNHKEKDRSRSESSLFTISAGLRVNSVKHVNLSYDNPGLRLE